MAFYLMVFPYLLYEVIRAANWVIRQRSKTSINDTMKYTEIKQEIIL